MKVLFISRRNNQAKYFKKLASTLACGSRLHIIGAPIRPSIKSWHNMLAFSPQKIVASHISRRSVRLRVLSLKPFRLLYACLINLHERYRYASYISLLYSVKPDKVAVWNGLKLPSETIVAAASTLQIPVIFFENGLLPGTCSIDFTGVNDAASLPRDPAFYINYPFSKPAQPIHKLMPRKPTKSRRQEHPVKLPPKFIFVPMQVPDDTQIVRHSNWIKSMDDLYNNVMKALDESQLSDIKIVFKEHPSWPSHFDHLYNKHPKAIFANGNETPDLINKSLGLITINSTVGLEGILLNKNVIVLGNSCYKIPGLIMPANNFSELLSRLKDIENWKPDNVLRENYLRFLNDIYCIPQNWSSAGEENLNAAKQRILGHDEYSNITKPTTHPHQ